MKLQHFLGSIIMLCLSSTCMAVSINLYDQPKADSKNIGTIDSNIGIIPIFTPKDSAWVKVADPRNGNVGWIKSSDLSKVGLNFNIISTGNGGQNYQVMQYGGTQPVSSTEMQKTIQEMQARQQALQKSIQQMMQNMYGNRYSVPVIMPVVIMPEQKSATLPKAAPVGK